MDINKVLLELDKLFAENRISEVEPFLLKALEETDEAGDYASKLSILNELIGFHRVTSEFDKAIYYGGQALDILKDINMEGTIPYATTLLNYANVYRASGNLEESLKLYKEIEVIYKNSLEPNDFLIASFYNNIALLYQEMGDFENAVTYLENALAIVKGYEDASSELATTYSNLGTSLLRLNRLDEAKEALNKASDIYDKVGEKGYHYSSMLSAMGEVFFKEGNYDKSLSYYEKAAAEIYNLFGENVAYKVICDNIATVKEKLKERNMDSGN